MNTGFLLYQIFFKKKINVALISCSWSKAPSKVDENNGLIRPPAESVPGLNNRGDWPISSPGEIGVDAQPPLASPFVSELVGVIGLTACSAYVRSYCIKWGLAVNADKTKTMIFSKQKRTMGQPMKYGESYLENADSFEYLGFKLKYDTAVSHLMADRASKARRVTHAIVQAISTNDNLSPRLSLNLFDEQIMTILNYGVAVWSVPRTYNFI